MSIFEPIPRESRLDDGTRELDTIPADDEPVRAGGSLDPRSIRIAGLVVAGIVVTGLVVSNATRSDPRQPRPSVAARVDPGAAAVEQDEANQNVPTVPASPSVEPSDDVDDDSPEDSRDDDSRSGDPKRDDKPGKGHGRGRH